MKKAKPIRMCISCKSRQNQSELNRFQINCDEVLFKFNTGRSMYLCKECLDKNDNDFAKSLQKILKNNTNKQELAKKLKERFLDGEYKNC